MDIISVALKRHSTKAFDASKKLTPEQAEQIKTLLQYSPSSTNSQPWHFIVASTEEGKARVAKSAAGNYVFNERKILDASHVVVFCAKTAMDDAWLKQVVDQEDADGRFATPESIRYRGLPKPSILITFVITTSAATKPLTRRELFRLAPGRISMNHTGETFASVNHRHPSRCLILLAEYVLFLSDAV